MSNRQNEEIEEMEMDYFKDNPRILCSVCKEHTFRVKGFDKNGNKRTYTMCMDCKLEEFKNINFKK